VSTEHYDLAARLRAGATARLVNRSRYAPALAPRDPIALTIATHPDGRWTLTATEYAHPDSAPGTAVRSATGYGQDALHALAALGVGSTLTPSTPGTTPQPGTGTTRRAAPATSTDDDDAPSEPFRTLVVSDTATLRRLHTILAKTPRGSRWDAQAAVLAWWLQRGEHPGTAAVLDIVTACTARWYTGEAPRAERHPETWLAWHHLSTNTTPGTATGQDLLHLAHLVTAGTALPGLDHSAAGDERSWKYHLDRLAGGWNFRRPDTRTKAALGLATRCDAAELYESQRLDDPLIADRARFDGTIVTGVLTWINDRTAELTADRLPCRLRSGTTIEGSTTDTSRATFRATIEDTRMSSTGELILTLDALSALGKKNNATALAVGDTVELRSERVTASQQQHARRNRRGRYLGGGNWLIGTHTPSPTRRDVPWDVVVAAATD